MKVELENYFNKSISCSVNESVRNCFLHFRTNIRRMYKNKLQNSVCRSVLKYIDSYIRDFIDIYKIVDKNCIIYIRTHVYEAIDKANC